MTSRGARLALGLMLAAALMAGASRRQRPRQVSARAVAPATSTSWGGPPETRPPAGERSPELVPWTGPVEHLFFHTLVIRPDLAFTHDRLANGFRDYFVTVPELRRILDQLYANGWTLVDIHRAIAGNVWVPAGRKPLVLSEDDVNYYDYARPRGLGWRLLLDPSGEVKVEVRDDQGVRVTDDDIVPIVDAFVASHPEFSADGAKGTLALTGYEGLFGERLNDSSSPDGAASAARATAIANRLRATGWTLASHSYGHIDLTKVTTGRARLDTERWAAVAVRVIGPTDVYVYPFGASPPSESPTVHMLRDAGFTIQCGIDVVPRVSRAGGVAFMSRRHIDGIAFAQQARALAPFFEVTTIEDASRRR
jgi:hypothetical protein